MTFTIESPDMNSLIADFGRAPAKVQRAASDAVRKTALDIEANAKVIVPVDTGNLKASIGTSFEWDSNGFGAEIGPTAFYGIFVEKGTSRMAPRAFMGPSLDRYSPGLAEALAQLAAGAL